MSKQTVFVLLFLSIIFIQTSDAQCVRGDCLNGEGLYRAKNGSTYSGTFRMGKFNGKGIMSFASKDKFVGYFKNGRKEGHGKYTFAAGHEYLGEFVADLRSGNGKMTYKNTDVYQGQWKNDAPNGHGKYLFSDGSSFEGEFTNGNFDGKGIFTEANGNSFEGIWKNNVLVSKDSKPTTQTEMAASTTTAKTKKIKDCTNLYCDNEEGKFIYRDGSNFVGQFVKGQPEGQGICTYVNGDVYKGSWKSHGPHGFGTMYKLDKSVHSGEWEYGALVKRSYETEALAKINQPKKEDKKSSGEIEVYSVIVGVATYNHMSSLRYTDDDAYHLYAFLKSPEGGAIPDENISLLIDDAATKKNIAREIGNTFSKADDNDVIILYMSGHGLDGNFVPTDFDGRDNLLSYDDILKMVESSDAKHRIYITDACHSGSMYASKTPYQMELQDFYNKFSQTKGGTAVITSSKSDEVSLEYSGMRHGVFSHYLIEGLKGNANKNGDNIINVQELFDFIYTNVRHHTNNTQTPSIFGDYDENMPVSMIRN